MRRYGQQSLPNPARRHFFKVFGALAGAATVAGLSREAAAQASDRYPCLLKGTRILTNCGQSPVESLSIGDQVITAGGQFEPIKWIGRRAFSQGPAGRWPDAVHPIRVARSALADNVPSSDLYLSPSHCLYIDGALIPVEHLVNGTSIAYAMPAGMTDIEYFHIELETHEVIVAEGAPVESLLVTDGRDGFTNFVEHERLYGRKAEAPMVPCAPIHTYPGGRAHLKALLRLGVSRVVDVRDPIQVAYDRIAARAAEVVIGA